MQVAFIEAIAAIGRDKLLSASDVADCLLPNVLANISHAPASPEVSAASADFLVPCRWDSIIPSQQESELVD